MIEKLQLKNFTAFKTVDMDFSPGVNILIGDNGTGKTHILKVLYSVLAALHESKRVSEKLAGVFMPHNKMLGRLVKRTRGSSEAKVVIIKNGKTLSLHFSNHTTDTLRWRNGWKDEKIDPSVYIPVKEMLENSPGFVSLYKNRDIHFEEVYADIIYKAFTPQLRGPISKERRKLLEMIQSIIEGKVISKEEEFFLESREGKLEFSLVAEGMRKLGLLWLLIQNGTLLAGAKLFWDEPETNLNPSMLDPVVKILLHLQRGGVQIFIATHNYVLLKEFDLQKEKQDSVKFFSLRRDDETKQIVYGSGNNYADIIPNKISEAYTEIYNQEVRRNLGGLVK